MIYIGIDVGFSGAVAMITPLGAGVTIHDFPIIKSPTRKGGHEYLIPGIVEIFDKVVGESMVAVERQGSMPGQGVASVFSLGRGQGILEGILSALKISYRVVQPVVWKRSMGLLKQDKDQSRNLAMKLFPQSAPFLMRKKDHGRAEALLIAEWLRRQYPA